MVLFLRFRFFDRTEILTTLGLLGKRPSTAIPLPQHRCTIILSSVLRAPRGPKDAMCDRKRKRARPTASITVRTHSHKYTLCNMQTAYHVIGMCVRVYYYIMYGRYVRNNNDDAHNDLPLIIIRYTYTWYVLYIL